MELASLEADEHIQDPDATSRWRNRVLRSWLQSRSEASSQPSAAPRQPSGRPRRSCTVQGIAREASKPLMRSPVQLAAVPATYIQNSIQLTWSPVKMLCNQMLLLGNNDIRGHMLLYQGMAVLACFWLGHGHERTGQSQCTRLTFNQS